MLIKNISLLFKTMYKKYSVVSLLTRTAFYNKKIQTLFFTIFCFFLFEFSLFFCLFFCPFFAPVLLFSFWFLPFYFSFYANKRSKIQIGIVDKRIVSINIKYRFMTFFLIPAEIFRALTEIFRSHWRKIFAHWLKIFTHW